MRLRRAWNRTRLRSTQGGEGMRGDDDIVLGGLVNIESGVPYGCIDWARFDMSLYEIHERVG